VVQSHIQTDSIDYWIGNISPRCAINIIYINFTNEFRFTSTHEVPVLFTRGINRDKVKYNHSFFSSFLRFIKAECYFNIIYYKPHKNLKGTFIKDPRILFNWIYTIVYGARHWEVPSTSNVTYCLLLHHGAESKKEALIKTIATQTEYSLALIYLSSNSTRGYTVYCKTPYNTLKVAAKMVSNETTSSIINPNFIDSCSNKYPFVAVTELFLGSKNYDPVRMISEHEVITCVLAKLNASLATGEMFLKVLHNEYRQTIPLVALKDSPKTSKTIFLVFDNSVQIFTCYSIPALSFQYYISAFTKQVWICIVLCGIVLATFLNLHIYYNISRKLNFSSVLFYFSICTEESFSIPQSIEKNRIYRMVTIIWLLTAVVLTNTYGSHVISELNAPLKGEKLKYIKDTYGDNTNVTLMDTADFYESVWPTQVEEKSTELFSAATNSTVERIHNQQKLAVGFTFLSEPARLNSLEEVWVHITHPFIYSMTCNNLIQMFDCYAEEIQNHSVCRYVVNIMSPSNKHYPSGHLYKRPWKSINYLRGAVEEELTQCHKSVYLEQSNQLEFKYMSENYKKKRFYYLQDGYKSRLSVWSFNNLQKSRIHLLFWMFLQSGIFHHLHRMQLLIDHQKRRAVTSEIIKRTEIPQALDMSSSVQTIFILFASMILIAKLAFAAELGLVAFSKWNGKIKHKQRTLALITLASVNFLLIF